MCGLSNSIAIAFLGKVQQRLFLKVFYFTPGFNGAIYMPFPGRQDSQNEINEHNYFVRVRSNKLDTHPRVWVNFFKIW